jgi:putative acetyltransferase
MSAIDPLRPFATRRRLATVEHVVRQARLPEDASDGLDIWREFVSSPSVSLDYQGYEAEFADLPGKYAPPRGGSSLLRLMDRSWGALLSEVSSPSICEMKRLCVRPQARGMRLGKRLASWPMRWTPDTTRCD